MKIGVYFCKCGNNISDKIDPEIVKKAVLKERPDACFMTVDFACSDEGREVIEKDLTENNIERVVISACSPREHESTFMKVLVKAGINPYLMQMANVRELIAWVVEDPNKASDKAARHITAALKRVALHEPLEIKQLDQNPDTLIIGAGPAGLKAALAIAESGRRVTIVEKTPVIGGMPVRFEELFPNMECGPCMLEPLIADILHGKHAENIELMTLSEVSDVMGYYGNFIVKIKKKPRYINSAVCIGCGECAAACPVSIKNEFNYGMNERKAVDFSFPGALPNVPSIDAGSCLRITGAACDACVDVCPLGIDAFSFDESEEIVEKTVGAIIVAIGYSLYDCAKMPNLGYKKLSDIYTSAEFERMAASNGHTNGEIRMMDGRQPSSIAIIHCAGSLDKKHIEYCSEICCKYAFKFNHIIHQKLPDAVVYHMYKELVLPGKDDFSLYQSARENSKSIFLRYKNIDSIEIVEEDGRRLIKNSTLGGKILEADMVILCPALVPADGSGKLGVILDASRDRNGFFEEMHSRMDSVQSKIRGIYLAGTCQSPMDIQKAMNHGMAAAGSILSGIVEGGKIDVNPAIAFIDQDRCSGCRICGSLCPYKAISFDYNKDVSIINEVLCHGCGTCVSACPCGAAKANHFTTEAVLAEIEGLLA
ncbi:MAG: CoB--CoM heterodisulfide reductase iron-sulfur subunit A family protein [Nitrospirae bacterium]|nr:CoB--CoM heterodisulfide reductase iron-sulfur subunit A family protein [Nitrospirota bacterium]